MTSNFSHASSIYNKNQSEYIQAKNLRNEKYEQTPEGKAKAEYLRKLQEEEDRVKEAKFQYDNTGGYKKRSNKKGSYKKRSNKKRSNKKRSNKKR